MKRLDLLYSVLRQGHGGGALANRRTWALQFLAACFAPNAAAQPGSRSQSGASSTPSSGPAPGSANRPDQNAPKAQAPAKGADALADWQRRSRAPGVLFAHAFESEAELTAFVRKPGAVNPLRIVQTDIGPALRGLTMGTTIVADVPEHGAPAAVGAAV